MDLDPIKMAILGQMVEEAAEAFDELRLHLEAHHPEVGKCPQRRADAEAWVCMAEVGDWTIE